jgi:hypothetical protein
VKRQFTVNVPLLNPTALVATRNGSSINVTWTAAPSATKYQLERISNGTWTRIAEPTGVSYTDSGLTSGATYAYRVRAVDANGGSESPYSNHDSASLITFSSVSAGMLIDDVYFHEILAAVNSVRAAGGLEALTWTQALAPDLPAVAGGGPILGAYVITLRSRMAEALQAVGVAVRPVTDAGLTAGYPIRAIYLTDLQHLVD